MRITRQLSSIVLLSAWLLAACSTGAAPLDSQAEATASLSPATSVVAEISQGGQPGCTVVSRQPTPNPTEEALIPQVSAGDWIKGEQNAPITLMEYSDFQ